MPRRSAASLQRPAIAAADTGKRPDPPAHLDSAAAAEWRRVVESLPPGWFPPESLAMLEDRCRQVVWLNQTSRSIEKLSKTKDFDTREYNRLVRLLLGQSRSLANLDTKMRLTQSATYEMAVKKKRAEKKRKNSKKPWEVGNGAFIGSQEESDQDQAPDET